MNLLVAIFLIYLNLVSVTGRISFPRELGGCWEQRTGSSSVRYPMILYKLTFNVDVLVSVDVRSYMSQSNSLPDYFGNFFSTPTVTNDVFRFMFNRTLVGISLESLIEFTQISPTLLIGTQTFPSLSSTTVPVTWIRRSANDQPESFCTAPNPPTAGPSGPSPTNPPTNLVMPPTNPGAPPTLPPTFPPTFAPAVAPTFPPNNGAPTNVPTNAAMNGASTSLQGTGSGGDDGISPIVIAIVALIFIGVVLFCVFLILCTLDRSKGKRAPPPGAQSAAAEIAMKVTTHDDGRDSYTMAPRSRDTVEYALAPVPLQ